jgi:hypothetical protein
MAMILRVTKSLSNNKFTTTISLESIDSVDQELMADFGEPSIDFGGLFTPPEAGITSTFTLPTNVRPIKSGLPQQVIREGASAKTEANDWATAILSRIQAELNTLRLNTDDFSGTTTSSL